jgi:hypothetical protein
MFLLHPPLTQAQNTTGSISGEIHDGQGAVIPNAKLTLTNVAQGNAGEQTSNAEGAVVFSNVLPGACSIAVEVEGFKKYIQSGITLAVNDKLGLPPVTLERHALRMHAEQLRVTGSLRSKKPGHLVTV